MAAAPWHKPRGSSPVAHPEQAASVEEAGAAAVKAAEAGLGTEAASHLAAGGAVHFSQSDSEFSDLPRTALVAVGRATWTLHTALSERW
eukprot:COSAG06_NODE_2415_length_6914_cov_11.993544_2_plen_89_part_00